MSEDKYQQDMLQKMDMVIRLLTLDIMKDKTLTEKIIFMGNAGFAPKNIAEILNTTGNYVNVILSNSRRKKTKEEPGQQEITEAAASQEANQDG